MCGADAYTLNKLSCVACYTSMNTCLEEEKRSSTAVARNVTSVTSSGTLQEDRAICVQKNYLCGCY